MPDNPWVLVVVGVGGPLLAAIVTYLGTRLSAGPLADQALTAKFSALVDRQERERAKLEAVAADLEVMVIRLLRWADEVAEIAETGRLELPERPRFADLRHQYGPEVDNPPH